MKPKDTDDVHFQEQLDELGSILSPSLRARVRHAKRDLKKSHNKKERSKGNRNLRQSFDDVDEDEGF
jgi:hypothetical protein